MPRERRPTITLKISDKDRIERLAKRYRLSMSEITGYLYEMCERYDMMRVGWESRMEKADEEKVAKSNPCPLFKFRETWHICVMPREDKPPKITKLSRKLNEALEICAPCFEEREIARKKKERNDELRRQLLARRRS